MFHLKTLPKVQAMSCLNSLGIPFHLEKNQELLTRRSFGGTYCLGANKAIPIRIGWQQPGLSI